MAPPPRLESETAHASEPLRRKKSAFFSVVLGTLGNARMRHRRGRDGHLSYQKLQWEHLGFSYPWAFGSGPLQSTPFKSDWLVRDAVCCGGECPLVLGGQRAPWDKALEHSIQETRIALAITPAPCPRRMNALSRGKKTLLCNNGC